MEFNGLPAHPLLVHVVVVMLPLASALAVLGSLWPAAQRKLTFLTPLAALAGMIAVPLTIQAGVQLAEEMGMARAIAEHAGLGRRLLPLSIALFVTTAGQWAYLAFAKRRPWLTVVIAALVIATAAATAAMTLMAGEAGAEMVWGSSGT